MKTALLSCTLVVGLAGAGCGGDTLTSEDADPGAYTCPGGCLYVTRDNPVLTNEAVLLRSDVEGIDEQSNRTEEAWFYHRFEFKIAQSGLNLARGTDTETTLAVWPSEFGKVEPAEGQTAILDFSIPGSRIGYSDLTFRVTKNRTVLGPPGTPPPGDTEITREAADTKVRLRPDVILVPIQVAQFVADYPGAPNPRTTNRLNEAQSRLLFDEAWQPSVLRSSDMGALTDVVGKWKAKNQGNFFEPAQNYTPDSIFQQCGIQFRMVKHIEVPANKRWWEMADGTAPACGIVAEGRLQTMRDASVSAGLRGDLPIVMHMRRLMNEKCGNYDTVLEQACNGSCGGANWAAIDSFHVLDLHPYVISHELGHVLGLDDIASGAAACSGVKTHLMCQYSSRQSENLQGGPSNASCQRARGIAADYAKRYFDTAGTDFSGGNY